MAGALGLSLEARSPQPVRPPRPAERLRTDRASGREEAGSSSAASEAKTLPMKLTPIAPPEANRPAWLDNASLPRPAAVVRTKPLPLPALINARQQRSIVFELLAASRPAGPVNVDAVIATIARGKLIARVPRRPRRKLAERTLVLLDTGPAMDPFALDQLDMARTIEAIVGRERVKVRTFAGQMDGVVTDPETLEEEPLGRYADARIVLLAGAGAAGRDAVRALVLDPCHRATRSGAAGHQRGVLGWNRDLSARSIRLARRRGFGV